MWAGKTFSAKFTSKEVLQEGIIKGKIVKVPYNFDYSSPNKNP